MPLGPELGHELWIDPYIFSVASLRTSLY